LAPYLCGERLDEEDVLALDVNQIGKFGFVMHAHKLKMKPGIMKASSDREEKVSQVREQYGMEIAQTNPLISSCARNSFNSVNTNYKLT